MDYLQKLQKAVASSGSCLCIGLDPNLERIPAPVKKQYGSPEEQVSGFLKRVIAVTSEYCAAYKPNLAFFEALGPKGLQVFGEILSFIPPGKIVIADAKRGDISSTAGHYAKAYFEAFNVDAVTLNPLMGFETLAPFLEYPGKGLYVLTLTSNPGAQDILMQPSGEFASTAAHIASRLKTLADRPGTGAHPGMVVGATKIGAIRKVIQQHPNGALLIPGIGTQGGSIDELLGALDGHRGLPLVNSSRSILYAGEDRENWELEVSGMAYEYMKKMKPIAEQYGG